MHKLNTLRAWIVICFSYGNSLLSPSIFLSLTSHSVSHLALFLSPLSFSHLALILSACFLSRVPIFLSLWSLSQLPLFLCTLFLPRHLCHLAFFFSLNSFSFHSFSLVNYLTPIFSLALFFQFSLFLSLPFSRFSSIISISLFPSFCCAILLCLTRLFTSFQFISSQNLSFSSTYSLIRSLLSRSSTIFQLALTSFYLLIC